MSWDLKNRGRAYYYRSLRIGDRVVKEYIGTGPAAERLALAVETKQAVRMAARQRLEEERARLAPAHEAIEKFCKLVLLLARAMLLLGGYRDHHGEWRRHHHVETRYG
jgi:hypothetical protein